MMDHLLKIITSNTCKILISTLLLFFLPPAKAKFAAGCQHNPKLQAQRSKELTLLVKADQDDRKDWFNKTPEKIAKVAKRDLKRRQRIGELFGEGCINSIQDYKAAALVYQHGDLPDHYFQAFIWANKAVTLGDKSATQLAALAIDRYLVSMGHKQLFASQAFSSSETNGCYCLQQIEDSYPEQQRQAYSGISMQKRLEWVYSLNQKKECPNIICPIELKPTPKGMVPGFW